MKCKSNKIEYSGFTNCKSQQTAFKRLADIVNKKSKNTGLDMEYYNSLIEGEQQEQDIHIYFVNEDNTFFRLEIERMSNNRFYIDCAFSV